MGQKQSLSDLRGDSNVTIELNKQDETLGEEYHTLFKLLSFIPKTSCVPILKVKKDIDIIQFMVIIQILLSPSVRNETIT